MFQQRGKFYLNASNWKCYQDFNYNNNKDIYQNIKRQAPKTPYHFTKFTYNLKNLNRLKKTKKRYKTGLRRSNSVYSIGSVKERLKSEAGLNTGIDIYKFKQKMANTLSVMTNVLRNVVSKQRIRYKEKGFNLDLAYVCDNIIAMGYPAEKYESMYRNRLEDVYKFLEENHRDHYKIYNLCLERSYDITKFHGRVSVYPFEDHNPPAIELILNFCEDVDNWLKADSLNVAAVHCKAGKGRTGTMICCYLLYSGQQRTAEDALACYDEKRTKDRKGVTIPSQRRYVQYFSKLMRLGLSYERRTLQFCEIRFSEANILHSQGTVHCSISVLQEKVQQLQNFPIDFRKNSVLDMKNPPLPVTGDIKVELTKNAKKIFHFWFNTFFVLDAAAIEGEGNNVKFVYTLHKWEIDDAHKDKEHKCFSEDFKVELVFYIDDTNVDRDHIKISSRLSSNHRTTMQSAGAVRMTSQYQHQHQQQQQQQQQQSNNSSLPQNNSSSSEMNYMYDQKSSSLASINSSLGGGGTDISNGYESNRSTAQRKCGVVKPFINHNSNHYIGTIDANNSVVFPTPLPTQDMTLLPNYMDQQIQQKHINKLPQQQHKKLTLTPNQRHLQRKFISGNVSGSSIVGGGGDVHANNLNNMNATCQPSTNVNTNDSNSISSCNSSINMAGNNFNYNHSNNSSKTSSVSSESSSSAIGDNEEDWESANTTTTQNNTLFNEVVATKLNILDTISSIDVIKQNKEEELSSDFGGNSASSATTINETKYNQQCNKQIIKNIKQQPQQPKLYNGIIKTDLANVTNKTANNTNTNISNSVATNTNTTGTSQQQLFHSCLQSGDLSSELKCC